MAAADDTVPLDRRRVGFEQRMMRSTFADHGIDDAKLAAVSAAFEPHIGSDGARFTRPMHVRLLRHLA